ncbi:hypothetical protein SteCoe_5560 [Stentor coeruleus]|uniref:Acyltransferase 3 domain-containing protein n=1 Tax=Stentor coeruleus TaxID=5963 RepID=A0A1R2CS23_9CILI|nr:hypothetical protein SteCoe_5560 [Stentor coeruleus]
MFLTILRALTINLVHSTSPQCLSEWSLIFSHGQNQSSSSIYNDMFKYSGFTLNNLGDYEACNKLDTSKYVVLSFRKSPIIVQTLCGPSVCEKSDYKNLTIPGIVLELSENYDVIFSKEYEKEHYGKFSKGALLMILIIIILVIVCVMAGVFDYTMLEEQKKSDPLVQLILCFSIVTNTKKLFECIPETKSGKRDPFDLINSARCWSIGWIILGHTCQFMYFIPALKNYPTAYDNTHNLFYYIVYGGFYAVDTFFVVVGFLMTYHMIHDFQKPSHESIFRKIYKIIIHRYLLFSSVYFFLLFFFWTLQSYLRTGPMWFEADRSTSMCEDYWWTNLIYINNFVPNYKGNACLTAGWYNANDLQFLLICILINLCYVKINETLGWVFSTFLAIFSIISSMTVAWYTDINPSFFDEGHNGDHFWYYYNKPYCRIGPYALGIMTAYIVNAYRQSKTEGMNVKDKLALKFAQLFENTIFRYFCFIFGLVLLNLIMYFAFELYENPGSDNHYIHWTSTGNIIFLTFERITASLGIWLILTPMLLGYFRLFSSLMSLYPFVIFARLNFTVFLIHSNLMEIVYRGQKEAWEFNLYTNVRDTIGFFFACQLFAIPVVLMVEMPVMNLEKYFLEGSEKKYEPLLDKKDDKRHR